MSANQRQAIREAIDLYKNGLISDSELWHRVACSYCGDFRKELCK